MPISLLDNCTLNRFEKELIDRCNFFDCAHKDLNEFFAKDSIGYSDQLLGKTYCFTLDNDPKTIVCAFTVSNDSIKTKLIPPAGKNKINRKIPHVKRMRSYPAVLIGRLGVNKNIKRSGIGKQLMDFIKAWFVSPRNKTGCRYVVVDSYNEQEPLSYYKNCGFDFIFSSEEEEKEFSGIPKEQKIKTRLMYFDLIVLKTS